MRDGSQGQMLRIGDYCRILHIVLLNGMFGAKREDGCRRTEVGNTRHFFHGRNDLVGGILRSHVPRPYFSAIEPSVSGI